MGSILNFTSFRLGLAWFICLVCSPLFGAHIIGGEMLYECLGYGKNGSDTTSRSYLITIKLYRDCASAGAQFDNPLGFTIYRRQGGNWVNVRGGNREFSVELSTPVREIEPPDYPCLVLPPNICGETGIYQQQVDLPIIGSEYLVVWQRCCRNNTITNILDPESTGATYFIEIHPESQRTCNNSPVFINFPPTVLCVNAPFKFDHSAFDKEGDLLVYEFCEPLSGGGRQGGGNCQSVIPTPDCLPPYTPVAFRFPYTALFPLGVNSQVTINSLNGIITGTPDVIGQFVVGVCVYEYRNGTLLSVVKRDFQFNVASCEGIVEARLGGASQLTPDQFSITLCGTRDYQFQNASIDSRYIKDVLWTYENGGRIDSVTAWAPFVQFEEGGWHSGRFILNPGSNCGDTGYFRINVIPDLEADFSALYDSCSPGPVQFTDKSSSTFSAVEQWKWSAGDGIVSFVQHPSIRYVRPGKYPVLLTVWDNFGCVQTSYKEINWFPSPEVLIFSPTKSEGCIPLDVGFRNISFPTDSSYRFVWHFSDGKTDSGYQVVHRFERAGRYGLKMEVTSPLGCYSERDFPEVIEASDPPVARWSVDKQAVSLTSPEVHLRDLSQGTVGRSWIVDGNAHYFGEDLEYAFADTGIHRILLIAVDRFLCTDTLETTIRVYREVHFYLPNAFTPNGDGKNDVFGPVGSLDALGQYGMTIYDRWGSKVFNASDPADFWNGNLNNSGKALPSGAYVCEVHYTGTDGSPLVTRQVFALIR